jgi:RnfABCDGE-type electron transport complex G subunit
MKTSLKMIIVLGLIAAISAGALAGVHLWTAPLIEENARIRLQQTLAQVIDAEEFVEQEGAEYPLWHAMKGGNLVGYVVRLVGQGYSSAGIDLLIGLDTEAKVQGVHVFSHSETPGLGDRVAGEDFLAQFKGKGLEDPIASGTDVDAISGATSSSMAVIGSVRRAVQFIGAYAGLVEETTLDFAQIPDGVYTGSGRGFGGEITVEVTFAGGQLTDLKVLSHSETSGISDPAFAQIPKAIKEQQTVDVDAVSGATMSSEGIKDAVRNALAEFGGDGPADTPIDITTLLPGKYLGKAKGFMDDISVEVIVVSGRIEKIKVLSHDDTQDIAEPAFASLIDVLIEAQDFEVDLVSGATYSSQGLIDAVKNALRSEVILDISALADGSYSGEAEGFSGLLQVSFMVAGGRIESMKVEAHNDTPDIAEPAFNQLLDAIIGGQTLEVDLVSGATYSSQGLLDAIKEAIKNGPALDVSAIPDGVYTGTGQGLFGPMKVEVTMAGGVIEEITVLEHSDTPEYAADAFTLINLIKERQTLDVDAVSGATGSSTGLLEAIEAALKGAGQ